ncbi:conserved protein of unknown function [Cupriavidus taiwanensis]|uniref:Uncharacterized protein n=1 Tax=Cupriavidus taiwanensis TaxID=164546 RepID=A0A375II21_9BURK|nr:methylamine utilization protein MauJ [Cupriavidus taiwanensis]SPK73730.1 conserved protein of unknown function [Cupriavidus taiwanensis]
MTKPYLRDVRADAQALLNQRGRWVVAGVEGGLAWPKIAQVVVFEGMDFILRPEAEDLMANIAFNAELYGLDVKQGQARILKFATALSWSDGSSLEVTSWVSGSHPIGLGKRRWSVVRDFMTGDGLPQPKEDEAWVALALFREGLVSKNAFYSFLSFFKVIASIHRDGRMRGQWIGEKLKALDADDALKRLEELNGSVDNIGYYLFEEGRNAIAHAEKDIFVNPDEPLDYERILRDTPLVRNLAEIAIEERYGILRRRTRYRTKGLDVVGFKKAIGPELWKMLLDKSPAAEGKNVETPDSVALVARRDASFYAYEGMTFAAIVPNGEGGVGFVLTDDRKTIEFCLHLDLEKESLSFDPLQDMARAPEAESPEAIDRAIKFLQFQFCIVCNGHIEVWDEKAISLIGRTDGYIPLNMFVVPDAFEKQIAQLQARRAELEKE